MPRRKKPYVPPNHALVDGARHEPMKITNGVIPLEQVRDFPSVIVPKPELDRGDMRRKVVRHCKNFNELTQLSDLNQFIDDVVEDCVRARTLNLEHLVKGARSKPEEWTAQVFARGLWATMQQHGLAPTISVYDDGSQIRQSLYLRLLPGLSKIAGLRVPSDVKRHALRAKRIKVRPCPDF